MQLHELSQLVDDYYLARSRRLEHQKELEELEVHEKKLKEKLTTVLLTNKLTNVGGKLAKVKFQQKEKPQVTDWEVLYGHIRTTNHFDLLQRRLTETAVRLRWDDSVDVPGVIKFPVYDITVSKP